MVGGIALFILAGIIIWGYAGHYYSKAPKGILIFSIHCVLGIALLIFGSIQTETGLSGAIGTLIKMLLCGIAFLIWGIFLLLFAKHKKELQDIRSGKIDLDN